MLNRVIRELEEEIRDSELRIIDGDARLGVQWRRLRSGAGRMMTTRALAAAGLLAAGWLLRRPRGRRAGFAAHGRPSWVARLLRRTLLRALPLLLPLATPFLNRRVALWLRAIGLPVGVPREAAPLRTAPALDLASFAGRWYEVARLPRRFEGRCASDVVAHYRLHDGDLLAHDTCLDAQGRTREMQGELRQPDEREPARLETTYAPAWLRWFPGVWADYWVIYVDAEYTVALVGTPERDGLWLLAREPSLPDTARDAQLELAARLGFDTARLRFTPHTKGA